MDWKSFLFGYTQGIAEKTFDAPAKKPPSLGRKESRGVRYQLSRHDNPARQYELVCYYYEKLKNDLETEIKSGASMREALGFIYDKYEREKLHKKYYTDLYLHSYDKGGPQTLRSSFCTPPNDTELMDWSLIGFAIFLSSEDMLMEGLFPYCGRMVSRTHRVYGQIPNFLLPQNLNRRGEWLDSNGEINEKGRFALHGRVFECWLDEYEDPRYDGHEHFLRACDKYGDDVLGLAVKVCKGDQWSNFLPYPHVDQEYWMGAYDIPWFGGFRLDKYGANEGYSHYFYDQRFALNERREWWRDIDAPSLADEPCWINRISNIDK